MKAIVEYGVGLRTDYLPDEGLVHVDASLDAIYGLNTRTSEGLLASLEKVKNWNKVFRQRGEIVSVPAVIEELKAKVKKCKRSIKGIKKFRKNSCSNNRGFMSREDYVRMDSRFKFFKSAKREYGAVCSILEKGVEDYSSRWDISSLDDVSSFLRGKKIAFADKELITAAILSGGGSGVLSGDFSLIENYVSAVRIFGFKDCFVCNTISSKTISIR